MTDKTNRSAFPGFQSPNYTQVPDELFDDLLAELSGAELKVLLYIIRRTFGFKRNADAISLSQMLHGIATKAGRILDRGTGLSKPTLLQALRSLSKKHIILAERRRSEERGDEPTVYKLNIAPSIDANRPRPVVKKLDQGVVKSPDTPVVKKADPQETVIQETELQLSNIRMASSQREEEEQETPAQERIDTPSVRKPETIGAVLQRRRKQTVADQEARQAIGSAIRDFARELGDKAPLKSSTTRALNLMQQANAPLSAFISTLYEARSITKERTTANGPGTIAKNRMSYFFAVLEDLLGLKVGSDDRDAPSHGE